MSDSKTWEYRPGTLDLEYASNDEEENGPKPQIALIGAGAMGAEHVETIEKTGRANLVGLYDPHQPSVEQALQKVARPERVKRYSSLEEIGLDDAVDTVIIATPNYTHCQVVEEVLKYHKHILVEKPFATTLQDAAKMVALTRNYDKVFQVGLEYRFKAVCQELLYEVKTRKTLGDVKMIFVKEYRRPFLSKWHQWNKFNKYSGGTLVEKCCHYFDLFNLLAEAKPVKVYASGGSDVNYTNFEFEGEKSDILDNAFVTVDYKNGIRACLNLCMFYRVPGPAREEVEVLGNMGSIEASDHPCNEIKVGRYGEVPARTMKVAFPPKVANTGSHGGATRIEHLAFYDAIQGNGRTMVTVEDGFWSVVLGIAAQQSIAIGEPVYIEEILRSISGEGTGPGSKST